MKSRQDRLNSLLKEVLSEVIRDDLHHIGISQLFTVTHVDITKDLHEAKVYISVIGSEKEKKQTLENLQAIAGKIGKLASKKVVMRFFPHLHFKLDEGVEKLMQIDELLKKDMIFEGILPVNKPVGKTSFSLIGALRRHTGLYTIGHAGTLDPFATGVMILLLGRPFTKQSNRYLEEEKEYRGTVYLGLETDTYDCTGKPLTSSPLIPTLQEIEAACQKFQGTIEQIPPMFSAKKVGGKKLYELARKGREIERQPVPITLKTTLLHYTYPT